MVLAELGMPHRRMKLDQQLSSKRNRNSKWTKVLDFKCETPELLEENIGNAFQVIGALKNVLDKTPVAQANGPGVNKWDGMR